jgi:hypothetical protein
MQESQLEINGNVKYLKVWYDPALKNWDECIQLALNKHKIKEAITILCMPRKDKRK